MDTGLSLKLGLEFDNLEDAWKFWVNYGGSKGFELENTTLARIKKMGVLLLTSMFVVRKVCEN